MTIDKIRQALDAVESGYCEALDEGQTRIAAGLLNQRKALWKMLVKLSKAEDSDITENEIRSRRAGTPRDGSFYISQGETENQIRLAKLFKDMDALEHWEEVLWYVRRERKQKAKVNRAIESGREYRPRNLPRYFYYRG